MTDGIAGTTDELVRVEILYNATRGQLQMGASTTDRMRLIGILELAKATQLPTSDRSPALVQPATEVPAPPVKEGRRR